MGPNVGSAGGGLGIAALCAALVILPGCADRLPRDRLGCLPFPGVLTLYTRADPEHLGVHCSEFASAAPPKSVTEGEGEAGRGILYTERAGFLDLAHLRETIDWAGYMAAHLEPALRARCASVEIKGRESTRYTVTLCYPHEWDSMALPAREELAREASIRIGERMAYLVMTWHEIITWYGYRSTVLIPEKESAFTYDDSAAHRVGLEVADRALRDRANPWDIAVTKALESTLKELGVVSRDETARAVEQVRGTWWLGGRCLHRCAEFMLEADGSGPMIAVAARPGEGSNAGPEVLPGLADVMGVDCRGMFGVEMDSTILEMWRIRSAAESPHGPLRPLQDFPTLVECIRKDAIEQRTAPALAADR